MSPGILQAVVVVTCALVFYSIGVILEQRNKAVDKRILFSLSVGVVLDITATILMIINSSAHSVTFHGILGYIALLLMIIDITLVWRHWFKNGIKAIPHKLHMYTRGAYAWWVVAYIVGAVVAAVS